MLPHKAPADKQLVYVPYWRFKGMIFSSLPQGLKYKFMDASQQALQSEHFPLSLGLRSQAMKLQFVTPDTPGHFIKPLIPYKDVMDLFLKKSNAALNASTLYTQAHIGESISLIYAPFYIDEHVYDAILNKPVPAIGEPPDITNFEGGRPSWKIRFVATLCPACGWDLTGARDSLALTCKNCNSVWYPGKQKFQQTRFAHIPGNFEDPVYLPFWRIRAKIEGLALDSYADLIRIANLPKVVQPEWENRAFRLWSPAFKVRPQTFLNLIKNTTLMQPGNKASSKLPKSALHPVSLPVSEAIETLKINLSGFIKPQRNLLPRLPEIQVQALSYILVYIPFKRGHHDYVNPDLKLSINRNQLSLAGNL